MRGEDASFVDVASPDVGSPPHARGRPNSATTIRGTILDHPRMRGEDVSGGIILVQTDGSPPHARGRLILSIPYSIAQKDHPRMRGEDQSPLCSIAGRGGSPPHARGRHRRRVCRRGGRGITPACAGKTGKRRLRTGTSPDHPRMRGEDMISSIEKPFDRGSPPHARGRHDRSFCSCRHVWITPACAGKTRVFT